MMHIADRDTQQLKDKRNVIVATEMRDYGSQMGSGARR